MKTMKFTSQVITGCLSAAFLLFTFASCSKKAAAPDKEVQLRNDAALGSILTDKHGHTLYYFVNDAVSVANCTGGCEKVWPVFNVDNLSAEKLGEGLNISDFGSITTSGKKQLTYKGRPLYYYAPLVNGTNVREASGATQGENAMNVWFVAKPDYTIMLTNAQLVGNDGKNYTSTYTEGTGKTLYFTDDRGVTLYTFKYDGKDKNTFTQTNFSNNGTWPIYETDKIVVPSSLNKSDFGSITVFGKKQLTYKGWPLYYFGQDNRAIGSNKGVSVPTPGTWPVPVKDMAQAPQTPMSRPTSSTLRQ